MSGFTQKVLVYAMAKISFHKPCKPLANLEDDAVATIEMLSRFDFGFLHGKSPTLQLYSPTSHISSLFTADFFQSCDSELK